MKKLRYLEKLPVLQLNVELCVGCGACFLVCPHRVFQLEADKAKIVDRGACIECGACAVNCPVQAIYVNPDEGCGCAALIINSWITQLIGKKISGCGC